MAQSSDQLLEYWATRYPQRCEAGRSDARDDIESGVLKIKLSIEALFLSPMLVELLDQKGIDSDLYGDVGGPPFAYVAGYNHEMEDEIDRRYGQDTMRTVRERAGVLEQQRRQTTD